MATYGPPMPPGILGSGQPAGPGLLGGMFSGFNPQAFSQGMVDNQGALMGLASGILGGVNMRQGLAQGLQNFQQGRQGDYIRNQRTAEQAAVKGAAAADTSLTPQMRQLLTSSPEIARAYLSQNLLNPNQSKMSDLELQQKQFEVANQGKPFPTWGEIGANPDGTKQYGWINVRNQSVTPAVTGGGNGSMFSAQSVDGQALNALVKAGKITPEQAATFAASKTSQNPMTGAVSLITPMALGGAGGPPQAGAPAPAGALPGVVDVTQGKPGGPLTEAQNRARTLSRVMEPEVGIVDQNFSELGKLRNQAGGSVPGVNNYLTSPGYQRAQNSLKTIIASYLYATSGATAAPAEVANQAAVLTPKPGEDPKAIADKLTRIHTMVAAVKEMSGADIGAQPQAPQSTGGGDWYDAGGGVKIRPKGP